MPSSNPRYQYDAARRRIRSRLKAAGRPCAICGKPIDYTLDWWVDPKDGKRKRHPMSFEVDEIIPVSRYREGGYSSPGEAAVDPNNCRAVHRYCNIKRGNALRSPKHGGLHSSTPPLFPTENDW